jgi:hypothetical protein
VRHKQGFRFVDKAGQVGNYVGLRGLNGRVDRLSIEAQENETYGFFPLDLFFPLLRSATHHFKIRTLYVY